MVRSRMLAAVPGGLAVGLAVLALGPALAPGFVLTYDMVFTPRQDLTPAALGLGSEVPRAVPVDALVAMATTVVPGELLQKIVLLATLVAAGWGAARLVPVASVWARAATAALYAWNPYVAERLFIGHWSLLVAYAALPWVARAGLDLRRDEPGAAPRLLLTCGIAAITATGGIIAAVTGLAAAGRRGARTLGLAGALIVVNLPWLVPSLLHPSGGRSDPAGVGAFSARPENWSGTVGSLLGFGGIWNSEVVPPSRGTTIAPLLSALVLAVAIAGARPLVVAWGRPAALALGAVAAGGFVAALAGVVPAGAAALRWMVAEMPGAGLLRDGQKWLAPFVLLIAVCFGLGAARLAARTPDFIGRRSLVLGAVLLPLAVLPDFAWGGFGRLEPVRYPGDWSAVRHILRQPDQTERDGDLVTLPFSPFRAFGWNGRRTVLDPAPRWFPVPVVTDDALPVGHTVIAGEDPRAAEIRRTLDADRPLGEIGVAWVLVEKDTPGPVPETALRGLERTYDGADLALYRVPSVRGAPGSRSPPAPVVVAVLAAELAAVGLLSGSIAAWSRPLWRRR